MIASHSTFYITGGTLRPDAPSYVEREADRDLYETLGRGEFCYVLTSRQMGKSSLMVRTASRLREQGTHVAVLDLTAVGQNLTAEQWYDGLLALVGQQLGLEEELEEFWSANRRLGPLQRWLAALRQVALARLQGPVVIFVDEIDAVRSLPFSTDELFAGIRECYNRRSEDPLFERLTFCLLGVATPGDLIQDMRTTPFNIGRRIELADFTFNDALPLLEGLPGHEQERATALQRVLHWTGGHPYLTQRLCRAVAEGEVATPRSVDRRCEALFLSKAAQEKDDNLIFVRERLLRTDGDMAGLLDLYGQVRAGRRVEADDTNRLVSVLRLAGSVRLGEDGRLRVRNRIYERVFDRAWIAAHMPDAELRRQRTAFRQGLLRAASVAGVVLVSLAVLTGWALRNAEAAQAATRRAEVETHRATEARDLLQERNTELADLLKQEAELREALELTLGREQAAVIRANLEAERARQAQRVAQAAAESERTARRQLASLFYEAGVHLAGHLWESTAGTARAVDEALAAQIPEDGEEDRREFAWRYQWNLLHRSALMTAAHEHPVLAAGTLPDGSLAALDAQFQLHHWRYEADGGLRGRAVGPPRPAAAWAISGDGTTFALGGEDGSVLLLDSATGQQRHALREPDAPAAPVLHLSFNAAGTRLLSLLQGGAGWVWDLEERRPVRSFTLGSEIPARRLVALSPDGWTVAASGGPIGVHLVQIDLRPEAGPQPRPVLTDLGGGLIRSITWLPDGSGIVTGHLRGSVLLSDAANPARRRELGRDHAAVTALSVSEELRWLASGGVDGVVHIWDLAAWRELDELAGLASSPVAAGVLNRPDLRKAHALKGHTGVVHHLRLSADGDQLVSASEDGTARVWNLASPGGPRRLGIAPGTAYVVCSPDGRFVSSGLPATLRNPDTGSIAQSIRAGSAMAAAFSGDSDLFATGHESSEVRLWDPGNGQRLATLPPPTFTDQSLYRGVASLALSPDGRQVVAGYGRREVTNIAPRPLVVWDVASGSQIHVFRHHQSTVASLAFTGDGRWLVSGSHDGTVILWDVDAWEPVHTFREPQRAPITSVALSPDDRLLAAGSYGGPVHVWELATRRERFTLSGHANGVTAVRFSPDGRTLASAGFDRMLRLWQAESGRELRTLEGAEAAFHELAFAPDGARLFAGGRTGVFYWDAPGPEHLEARRAARRQRLLESDHPLQPNVSTTAAGRRLDWEPVPAAGGYHVYRGPAGAVEGQLVRLTEQPVTQTSFEDRIPFPGAGELMTYALVPVFHLDGGLREGRPVWVEAPTSTAPPGWEGTSINEGNVVGSVQSQPDGTWEIRGGGGQTRSVPDGFYFVAQPFSGDGEIIVRLVEMEETAQDALAGVMLRDTLAHDAAFAFFGIGPGGTGQLVAAGGPNPLAAVLRTNVAGPDPLPRWLRLIRRGQQVIAHTSRDGATWTFNGVLAARMGQDLFVGLAVCAMDSGQLATARFADVRVIPQEGGSAATAAVARDGQVVVSVRDTGIGIEPEALPRVFERFYRTDRGRSRAEGGTGLGLAIVRHLVEAQGGRLWAESEVGKGSCFCLALPPKEGETESESGAA